MAHKNTKQLLTTKEAAIYLRISRGTLQNWRYKRKGPAYLKIGGNSIRYCIEDLDSYAKRLRVEWEGELPKIIC
jgi:excisionase family DNA binding protein